MRIIDKYIATTVLSAIGLVTLMLIGLQIFILFVQQIDIIGRGDFGVIEALYYVILQVPYQVYLFFPVASLLGCLIGLGVLANHSELIVMRAAGFSIWQIIAAVLKTALLLVIIVTTLGETIIPQLVYSSENQKTEKISGGQALVTTHGVWLRSGNSFVNIDSVISSRHLQDILQYQFDKQHRLVLARQIKTADYTHGMWQLHEVKESHLSANHVQTNHFATMRWDLELNPKLMMISTNEPDEMTLWQLYQFITLQHQNHQRVGEYEIAFWQRLFQPITTCVMMFLAIPFIFGPLRSATMGSRLITGATVGFSFHMLNKFFGPVSQVYQLSPVIGAAGPTILFALLAFVMMRRV